MSIIKPRLLTGDTPTGKLHLGHWVGSLENRVQLQDEYDCYFIIANMHAFTTRMDQPEAIRQSVLDITLDFLAAGIDPEKSTIFLQSEIPAISDLTFLFSMLIPYPRLMRNPTIKDEIRDKNLGDNYPFGFLLYPIGQVADILAFRPSIVPVGEDQIPHIEMTREVARKFNSLYGEKHPQAMLPIVEAKLGRARRLVGTGGPSLAGTLNKMSKSLNNTILLSDDPDAIKQKVMSMYTDPKRLKATDRGSIDNNPLWIFHDLFNADTNWVKAAKARYQEGTIGDVECKKRLIDVLVALIEPMRQRRVQFQTDPQYILSVLQAGTHRANIVANQTLILIKQAIEQSYF